MARDKNWILIEDGTGFQKWILKDKWELAQQTYKELHDATLKSGGTQEQANRYKLRIVKEAANS